MQYHQSKTALGSQVTLNLVADSEKTANVLFEDLWRQIFRFERQFSRFLPNSELSSFNRAAGVRQAITPEFKDLLLAAKAMAERTGGLYNPFILPSLQAAGYDHSLVKGYEQDAQDDHSGKAVVDAARLEIGSGWALIPYGTALDMGGCGKGYLADLLAEQVEGRAAGYWLSLGGDIIAGGQNHGGQAWEVGIQDAQKPAENIGRLEIPAGRRLAVATSGTIARKGVKHRRNWHHLIDPRTKAPAVTDVVLATVAGRSALAADVLASCAVITGSAAGPALLKRQKVAAALLQLDKPSSAFIKIGKLVQLDSKRPTKDNRKHKHHNHV